MCKHKFLHLSLGTPPSNQKPYGDYPLVFQGVDGDSPVCVVTAYAYGKYFGRLDVTFDEEGRVTDYGGNPILLDKTVEQGKYMHSIFWKNQYFTLE